MGRDTPPRALSGAPLSLGSPEVQAALEIDEADRYEIGGLLGRGGMGEVHAAWDRRLEREVALKTAVASDPVSEARLLHEATLTARLSHPGIVPIYGAGRGSDGRVFYTMPVVRGRSLAEALRQGDETRPALLRRFLDACDAVAYAHARGLLHRDLKPGNILLGDFGATLVVDWGLALAVQEAARGGSVVGTPEYMSPEQRAGEALDPRADVYALGATLHELLCGHAPAEGDLPDEVPRELAAIAHRALASDPARRYPGADALARDVAAWLDGRPVGAYRYSPLELGRRAIRAWRVPLAVAAVGLVGLAFSGAVGWWNTATQRDLARAHAREAEQARATSDRNLAHALVARARDAAARGERARAETLAAHALELTENPEARGVLARFAGPRPYRVGERALPCRPLALQGDRLACTDDRRTLVLDVGTGEVLQEHPGVAHAAAFGRDGLVRVMADGEVHVGDRTHPYAPASEAEAVSRNGDVVLVARGHAQQVSTEGLTSWNPCGGDTHVIAAADGPDGWIAVCDDGAVRVGPLHAPGEEVGRLHPELGAPIGAVAASPEGGGIAVGTALGRVAVIDQGSVMPLDIGRGSPTDLALDGDRLAVTAADGDVTVWSLETGQLQVRLPARHALLRWEDGALDVAGQRLERWRLPASHVPHVRSLGSGIAAIDVDPDGRRVASAHGDGRLRVHRLDDGTHVAELPLHDTVVKDVAFSPDGRLLAAAAAGETAIHLVDTSDWTDRRVAGDKLRRLAWLDEDTLLGAAYGPWLQRWSPRSGGSDRWPGYDGNPYDLESSRGRAVVADVDGALWQIDVSGLTRTGRRPGLVAVAASDTSVLVAGPSYVERLDDGARIDLPGAPVADLAVDPSGRWVAVGHLDGSTTVLDGSLDRTLAVLRGHDARVVALAFHPSGSRLLTGSWDGTVRLWSLEDLVTDPSTLVDEVDAAWGRSVEEVLQGSSERPGFGDP